MNTVTTFAADDVFAAYDATVSRNLMDENGYWLARAIQVQHQEQYGVIITSSEYAKNLHWYQRGAAVLDRGYEVIVTYLKTTETALPDELIDDLTSRGAESPIVIIEEGRVGNRRAYRGIALAREK